MKQRHDLNWEIRNDKTLLVAALAFVSAIWLMEETGLPYERVLTDITTGAQKAPEYLAVNPMGKVPGLKDGDAALGEAAAICA